MKNISLFIFFLLLSNSVWGQILPSDEQDFKTMDVWNFKDGKPQGELKDTRITQTNVRIEYLESNSTTYIRLESSVFSGPILYVVKSAKRNKKPDGTITYLAFCESFPKQSATLIVNYKEGDKILEDISIVSEDDDYCITFKE